MDQPSEAKAPVAKRAFGTVANFAGVFGFVEMAAAHAVVDVADALAIVEATVPAVIVKPKQEDEKHS